MYIIASKGLFNMLLQYIKMDWSHSKKNSKIKYIIGVPSLANNPKGIAKLQLDIMNAPMTKTSQGPFSANHVVLSSYKL
jgi:hypothetical protein